jgi:copper chaperone CopZ
MTLRFLHRTLTVILVTTALLSPLAEARTWTQAGTGKTIEADFIRLEGGQITLKVASGKEYTFPLERLVEDDQAFAREAMKKVAEEEAEKRAEEEKEARQDRRANYHLLDIDYVNICCDDAYRAVDAAAKKSGLDYDINRKTRKVTYYAKPKGDSGTEQEDPRAFAKAVKALLDAGYYGDESSTFNGIEVMKIEGGDTAVEEGTFTGIHLCCDTCVKKVKEAVADVEGVKTVEAEKGAAEFSVTGTFLPADVIRALRDEGLNAQMP